MTISVTDGGGTEASGGGTGLAAHWKPACLWLPSQNGRLALWPQRHRDMGDFPARSHSLPSASHSTIGPSTRSEPLGRTVIFTDSDMRCAPPGWIPASPSIAAHAATAAREGRAVVSQFAFL